MNWQTGIPTEPGWYWLLSRGVPRIAWVRKEPLIAGLTALFFNGQWRILSIADDITHHLRIEVPEAPERRPHDET